MCLLAGYFLWVLPCKNVHINNLLPFSAAAVSVVAFSTAHSIFLFNFPPFLSVVNCHVFCCFRPSPPPLLVKLHVFLLSVVVTFFFFIRLSHLNYFHISINFFFFSLRAHSNPSVPVLTFWEISLFPSWDSVLIIIFASFITVNFCLCFPNLRHTSRLPVLRYSFLVLHC